MTDHAIFIVGFSFIGLFTICWIADRILEQIRGPKWGMCECEEHNIEMENRLSTIAEIVEKIEANLNTHPNDMVTLLESIDSTLVEMRDAITPTVSMH